VLLSVIATNKKTQPTCALQQGSKLEDSESADLDTPQELLGQETINPTREEAPWL